VSVAHLRSLLMTTFKLVFSEEADDHLDTIELDKGRRVQLKAVRKTLGLMETNLRHPSLNTHEFTSLKGPNGEKVFESYAQNKTPGAYRIFWYYGPGKTIITVAAIIPHP
jgi:hypothetical protein